MTRKLDQFAQVFEAADRIRDGAAFDAEDDIIGAFLDHIDHPLPIHNTVTAGAAHRGAGDLAALCTALLHGNILGVQVDEAVNHVTQPFVCIIRSSQEGIAGVVIDPDSRGFHQVVDAIQSLEGFAVLLVRFQTDLDSVSLGNQWRLPSACRSSGCNPSPWWSTRAWGLHRC